jgi:uncharacterized protein
MQESRYNIWVEKGEAAYVFNGISGALLCLSYEDYRAFRRFMAGEDTACSPDLLARLAQGIMVIPDDTDEVAFLRRRYASSRYDTSQFGLTIVTSLGCNFDCPYCFEAKHPSIMDESVQELVLQAFEDQLPQISSFRVNWYGGEPLVGKKPLLALSDLFIDRCNHSGVTYSAHITTNGYLLDEQTSVELRDRKVESVQVCLDGPPQLHDKMRPLVSGKGTFWQIIKNLHEAVNYLKISIRVNVNKENFVHVEELLQILASEGFANKLTVYAAQIVGVNNGPLSPSAAYKGCCFTNPDFALAELEFFALATRYGFAQPSLPVAVGTPCTAVRSNELVVGSKGELYKCWESVGNRLEVIGHIRDYQNPSSRLQKWLKYDPFADAECKSCIALPVCMGGCAQHAMEPLQYENRCGTFRHTYRERVLAFVESASQDSFVPLVAPTRLTRRTETR